MREKIVKIVALFECPSDSAQTEWNQAVKEASIGVFYHDEEKYYVLTEDDLSDIYILFYEKYNEQPNELPNIL